MLPPRTPPTQLPRAVSPDAARSATRTGFADIDSEVGHSTISPISPGISSGRHATSDMAAGQRGNPLLASSVPHAVPAGPRRSFQRSTNSSAGVTRPAVTLLRRSGRDIKRENGEELPRVPSVARRRTLLTHCTHTPSYVQSTPPFTASARTCYHAAPAPMPTTVRSGTSSVVTAS